VPTAFRPVNAWAGRNKAGAVDGAADATSFCPPAVFNFRFAGSFGQLITSILRPVVQNRAVSKSLKNISVVASATLGSRVLGLVRETLTAAVFGVGALASAFATAFQLPNLFRRLLAEGGMTAAFVPTLTDALEKRQRVGAFALVNQVSSWLLVTTVGIAALAMALLSQHGLIRGAGASLDVDADTVERWLLAAQLGVILFPYLVFVCLAAAFSAALQTLNRFLEPALSPIWLNVAMISALVAGLTLGSDDQTKMYWFCGGVLVGGFLQMAVPAWALTREGWRPRLDLTLSEPVRAVARLMAPTILGSSVYLINMVVSRFIGLSLNDEAVSVLNYATRLMELPIGVFAVAVSTVVFPVISRYAAQGNHQRLGEAYRDGMRLILLINIPAAIGLGVLAEPIIRLVFQHGAFGPEATRLMTPILIVFALGLPLFSFVNLALRAFYAYKDTTTPVRAAVLSFLVNLGLSLVLMKNLSTLGLAVASTAAVLAQALYLQWKLAARGSQFAFSHLWTDLAKIATASALMGVFAAGAWKMWRAAAGSTFVLDAVGVGVVITSALGIYGILVWIFRIQGREEFEMLLRRFLGKLGLLKSTATDRKLPTRDEGQD
jgi:putative peptidoglycan lipid II flippase